MRVIMISSNMSEVGGIQRLIAVLANKFSEDCNIDVDIVNIDTKKGDEKFKLNKDINCLYMNLSTKNLNEKSIIYKIKYNIIKLYGIRKYFKSYKFEKEKNIILVFGHTYSCIIPYAIKKQKNIKIIGSQHSPITQNYIYSILRKLTLKKLDKYILINKTMQDELLKYYKLDNTLIIENPNTIIGNKISSLNNKQVIAVGRLTEEKGFSILIDIWKDVYYQNPEWNLKIIGEGPLKNSLLNQIQFNKLEKNVTIKNFTRDISKEYVKSDILVMTSNYEGFGLVLVEAQSCSLPVIAFDCPVGPKNIINNSRDGYLVEFGNKKEFATKLNELINSFKLREKMGKNAKENSERFNLDVIYDKWNKLFNEI